MRRLRSTVHLFALQPQSTTAVNNATPFPGRGQRSSPKPPFGTSKKAEIFVGRLAFVHNLTQVTGWHLLPLTL
jgi:hypothetical protein